MPSDSKISQLIIHLTKATVDKKIEWTFVDAPESITAGTSDIIPICLEGLYKNERILLIERRYREFDVDTESSYWAEGIILMIVNEFGRVLFDCRDYSPALDNLFKVARDSAADIDGILTKLLE